MLELLVGLAISLGNICIAETENTHDEYLVAQCMGPLNAVWFHTSVDRHGGGSRFSAFGLQVKTIFPPCATYYPLSDGSLPFDFCAGPPSVGNCLIVGTFLKCYDQK